MRKLIVGLMAFILAASTWAELRLPAVFSDGMVLQRDQEVPVWGWSDPGTDVTVSFAGQKKTVKVSSAGRFIVRLTAMKASAEPRKLTVFSATEEVEVENVLVGEVWLCSGQSNMQFEVKKAKNFRAEKGGANYPLIRMFLTDLIASRKVQKDCTGSWMVCSPESVGEFSAVAYFFGREIHENLNVPIGLIRSAWGGTPVEAWSPMESLKKFPVAMADKQEKDRLAETFDDAAVEKHNAKIWADYNRKVEVAKAEGKKWPPWPREKVHPHKSHRYPANLYNAMIHPLVPYGMRGAIWYQGENNTKTMDRAMEYQSLLENMIMQWRKDWASDFPFYAVQLVNFHSVVDVPQQDTTWARVRESFLKLRTEVPNVGMAVGIDVGEADDIHPKDKQTIGYRLAQQALANTYEKDIVAGGPLYRSMEKDDNKIILSFGDVGSGLVEQGGEPLRWFAIAGEDKQFVVAQAAIVDDTVIVSSAEVSDPVSVRYAWADNPVGCNLYNKEGFPASPFRTDDWEPMAAQP